ncbi:MAG: MBG domain-containing protein, partial [Actinomycetota bacterium]
VPATTVPADFVLLKTREEIDVPEIERGFREIDIAPLTIARASLGITASSFTITYGDSNPVTSTSVTFSGLAAGDSITSVTITYSGSGLTSYGPTTVAPTDVGTYTLNASAPVFSAGSTGSASTYTITYSPGLLTISRAVLTVTSISASVTYGDARPTLSPAITGWKFSQTASSAAGFISGTCSTSYTVSTNVSASPVATSCLGYSAGNYSFMYVSGAISISRKPLSISGTSISSRVFNNTKSAGTVVAGTLSGLMNGERLTVTGVGSDYSSENPGTYTSTVTYTLGNDSGGNGLADNYTLSTQSGISGTITPIAVGFNLTSTLGLSDVFSASFGNKINPVTLTATVNEAGDVAFQYSTNGGSTWTNVSGCTAVAVVLSGGNGAANCNFNSPTDGAILFRANFTPTDISKQSRTASLETRIVPRPSVTSFSNSSGTTITSAARGSTIAINGLNFLGVTSISFNGSSASMVGVRATSTRIIVNVPAGATTGLVKVTTLYGGESVGLSLTIP